MCYVSCVTFHMSHVLCKISHVMCQMSNVICHQSPVISHLSLMPTATEPHPANFPTMHGRLVCNDLKTQKQKKRKETFKRCKNRGFLVFQNQQSIQLSCFQLSTEETYIFFYFYKHCYYLTESAQALIQRFKKKNEFKDSPSNFPTVGVGARGEGGGMF